MTNLGIIIQCRLNSKRFPNKILKKIYLNQSVLEFLIQRLKKYFSNDKIIIASSDNDYRIKNIVQQNNVQLFVGSEKNVILEFVLFTVCDDTWYFSRWFLV